MGDEARELRPASRQDYDPGYAWVSKLDYKGCHESATQLYPHFYQLCPQQSIQISNMKNEATELDLQG